jgi:hypothetical protein
VVAKSQRVGLTWAIFLSFAAALAALLMVLFIVVPSQVEDHLTRSLYERGHFVAKEIERRVLVTPREFDAAGSTEISQIIAGEADIRYAGAFWCENDCTPADQIAFARTDSEGSLQAILSEFNLSGHKPYLKLTSVQQGLAAQRVSRPDVAGSGWILVTISHEGIQLALSQLRSTLMVAFFAGTVGFVAVAHHQTVDSNDARRGSAQ